MRGTLFCIVLHLPNTVPSKTIGRQLFFIVLHLPNAVPSRTMQNNANLTVLLGMQLFCIWQMQYRAEQCRTMRTQLFYSVCNCSTFDKCQTMRCNGIQCPPPVDLLPGSVIIIQFTHTGATPRTPLPSTCCPA